MGVRRNLISWWSSWPMKELFSSKLLCKWQRLACSPRSNWNWNFLLLCQSCHFLTWVVSKAFFMPSWLMTCRLSDRGRSYRDTEAFKCCSTRWTIFLLTFSCFQVSVFLKPARNKVVISIILGSFWWYSTFSKF